MPKLTTHLKRHARKAHRLLKHAASGKRIIKHHHAKHLARGFFITVATLCTGSLALAIAATRPGIGVQLSAQLRPGTHIANPAPAPAPKAVVSPRILAVQDGRSEASWYALGLPQPDALTCASRTYGRGSYLQVTNLRNGKAVICLVNDYGPEAWTGRQIDLSRGSFRVVEDLGRGTMPVKIELVSGPPQGFNVDGTKMLGSIMGYSLCQGSHSAQFCDANRWSEVLTK
jgi:Lytic transglycolase